QGGDMPRTDRLGDAPQVTLALHAHEHAAKVLVAPILFHSARYHGGLLHKWLDAKRSHARRPKKMIRDASRLVHAIRPPRQVQGASMQLRVAPARDGRRARN